MGKEITLDPNRLYDDGVSLGLCLSMLQNSFPAANSHSTLALAAIMLLSPELTDEVRNQVILGMLEIINFRKLKMTLGIDDPFPDWDPEDKHLDNFHGVCDVALLLEAANLSNGVELSDYLGPLYTLSGALLEGIAYGYAGDGSEDYSAIRMQAEKTITRGNLEEFYRNNEILIQQLGAVEEALLSTLPKA